MGGLQRGAQQLQGSVVARQEGLVLPPPGQGLRSLKARGIFCERRGGGRRAPAAADSSAAPSSSEHGRRLAHRPPPGGFKRPVQPAGHPPSWTHACVSGPWTCNLIPGQTPHVVRIILKY